MATIRRYTGTCMMCGAPLAADVDTADLPRERTVYLAVATITTEARIGLYCRPCDVMAEADGYTMEPKSQVA